MINEKVSVSVIVCAFNEEKNISSCIEAILNQDFKDFELIIVDDGSCDNTGKIINRYSAFRIRYISNTNNLGPAGARNVGLSYAKGMYVFFTDADCLPASNWISQGLGYFKRGDCVGVVGLTLPDKYPVTASDRIVSSENNKYQTCNIAYRRNSIIEVGGFDEYLKVGEDLDLGYRIEKLGRIRSNSNMLVLHKVEKWRLKPLLSYAWQCGKGMVYIVKKHRLSVRVIYPRQLLGLVCPPLLVVYYPFQSREDFKALPLLYLRLMTLRSSIWVSAFKYRMFLL